MRIRTAISLLIVGAFGAGLAACGGGSVSTGGGSGAGGADGASSSIVVQAPRSASAYEFQGGTQQDTRLAAAISEFLISDALAQAEEEVFLVNSEGVVVDSGFTDGSGQISFAVDPGVYEVCFGDPEIPENCTEVVVDEDQIILLTLELTEDDVLVASVEVLNSEDDIVEDPNSPGNADKVLVCHKGKFTISVARPAALTGHMVHGDTQGPCPETAQGSDDDFSDDNSRGGPPDGVPGGPPDGVGNNQST